MSEVFSSPSFHRPLPAPYAGTHGLKLLVWVEAGFSSCREVTENPERIPRAALIGIDPVFPCRRASGERMSRGLDPTAPALRGEGRDLTVGQMRMAAVQLFAHEARALSRAGRAPQLLYLEAQRLHRGQHLLQAALQGPQARRGTSAPAQPMQLRRGTLGRGGDGGEEDGRRERDRQK